MGCEAGGAYHKIWSELSPRDREVVKAIQQAGSEAISDIRRVLNWTSNQFNPYRDRLLRAGVINSPQPGFVALSLPWFGDFAAEQSQEEMLEHAASI